MRNEIVNAPCAAAMDDARAMNPDNRHHGSHSDTLRAIIDVLGDVVELVWHLVSSLIEFLALF